MGTRGIDIRQYFPNCKVVQYQAGEVVCDINSARTTVYILLEGLVRVNLMSSNGSERLLHYRRNGCFMGDTSCFGQNDLPLGLCAVAVEPSQVMEIPHDEFRSVLATTPDLGLTLLRQAHEKIASLMDQLEYAAFGNTVCQLAALIGAIAQEARAAGSHNEDRVRLNMTHQMMAAATGRTRVMVTYALNRLQDLGVLRLHKGQIEVLDLAALARYADPAYPDTRRPER